MLIYISNHHVRYLDFFPTVHKALPILPFMQQSVHRTGLGCGCTTNNSHERFRTYSFIMRFLHIYIFHQTVERDPGQSVSHYGKEHYKIKELNNDLKSNHKCSTPLSLSNCHLPIQSSHLNYYEHK